MCVTLELPDHRGFIFDKQPQDMAHNRNHKFPVQVFVMWFQKVN